MWNAMARALDEASLADKAEHVLSVGAWDLILKLRPSQTSAVAFNREPPSILIKPHPHLSRGEMPNEPVREPTLTRHLIAPPIVGDQELPLHLKPHHIASLGRRERMPGSFQERGLPQFPAGGDQPEPQYASESALEAFCAVSLTKTLTATFDHQLDEDRTYNQDPGPAVFRAARRHVDFWARSREPSHRHLAAPPRH
jgi:hypothetical protein